MLPNLPFFIEHELNTIRGMVPWAVQPSEEDEEKDKNGSGLLQPNFTSLGYDELPRFLQFKDASGVSITRQRG